MGCLTRPDIGRSTADINEVTCHVGNYIALGYYINLDSLGQCKTFPHISLPLSQPFFDHKGSILQL